MKDKRKKSILLLRRCLWTIFVLYLLLLLRITLFKQVSLYNLFSAFGTGERSVNLIPFYSIADMIHNHVSAQRIIENLLGNILLFIPFGLIIYGLFSKFGAVLLLGISASLGIEILQFALSLGSSDIDDLLFNTIGTAAGILLSRLLLKRIPQERKRLTVTIVILLASGISLSGWLLVNHTEMFQLFPKKTVVENEELVAGFIDTMPYLTGKFIGFSEDTLTIEKSIHNAGEARENAQIRITSDSRFFLCRQSTTFFFNAVAEETYEYTQLDYTDFIATQASRFDRDNNIQIWSRDGQTADSVVIIEYLE